MMLFGSGRIGVDTDLHGFTLLKSEERATEDPFDYAQGKLRGHREKKQIGALTAENAETAEQNVKTEDRGQRTEDRRQQSVVRSPSSVARTRRARR